MKPLALAAYAAILLSAQGPASAEEGGLAAAEELMGRGQYAEAIPGYKKALESNPSEPRALYGISYCYIRIGVDSGQNDELWSAEDCLKRLVEAAPAVPAYRFLRGWWAFTLAPRAPSYTRLLYGTAEEEFAAVVAAQKDNLEAFGMLAASREALGKYKEAAAAYRSILEAAPDAAAYYPRIADCYFKAGMHPEAAGACRIGLAKDPAGRQYYLKVLGDSLKASGDLKGAEEAYAAGLAADPLSGAWYDSLWLVLIDPASEGGSRRCEEVFASLAAAHADAVHPLKYYAVILRTNGRKDAALEALKKWASSPKAPGREWAWLWMGELLAEAGRPEESDAAFVSALSDNPEFANVFNPLQKRFTGMRDAGRFADAASLLRKISATKPKSEFHAWVLFELGADLQDLGDREGALAAWRDAELIDPAEPRFNNTLGLELRALGRIDEAIEQFRKAMEKSIDFMYSMENLAVTYLQMGMFAEARDMLRKSCTAAEEQFFLASDPGTRAEREFDLFKFPYLLRELREIELAGRR